MHHLQYVQIPMPNAHALAAVRSGLPLCAMAVWTLGAVIMAATTASCRGIAVYHGIAVCLK